MVPHKEERQGTRTVCRTVWEDVEQTYTVCVPVKEERQGVRKVCRRVPVTKTRTVCKDEGHWEEQPCGGCSSCAPAGCNDGCNSGCGSSCGGCAPASCCTRRVWVPNIVQHEVEYTCYETEVVEEPYTYCVTTYKKEERTRTVKVARQVTEEVPYTYCVTVCKPEERTCTVKVARQVTEEVPYTYCVTVCKPEERTCTVKVARQVTEEVPYTYCVTVCKPEEREVQVQVCRMVEKTVTQQVYRPACAAPACDSCGSSSCGGCH